MEQLYERINKALQYDFKRLVQTIDNPETVLAQVITEMANDLKQFRHIIDVRSANQQTVNAEDGLKDHTHHIAALRCSLLKLETKLFEAQWFLSKFGRDGDLGDFAGARQPNPPLNPPQGAEAEPEIDGQATSSIP